MDHNKNKELTEKERQKRKRLLYNYNTAKEKGFWKYSIKQSLTMAVGISIAWLFTKPISEALFIFPVTFVFGFILAALAWSGISNKIENITKELEQGFIIKEKRRTNPLHLLIFFLLIPIIISPLFFKKELNVLDKKYDEYKNNKIIQTINKEYSLEPTEIEIQVSDGSKAFMTIPKAYLSVDNSFQRDGIFSDLYSSNKVHLAATLPNLEPWKLTKEALEHMQTQSKVNKQMKIEEGFIMDKIMNADSNYVGIGITLFAPFTYNDILPMYSKASTLSLSALHDEENYGLNIYHTKLKVPGKLQGNQVYFYNDGILAVPVNQNEYPPMIFGCNTTCTIISSYNNKVGLILTFHSVHLDKWQEIWKKANSKLNDEIKWQ